MRAYLVNEDVKNILVGKSKQEIEETYEKNKIQDHFITLKKSVNELLNNEDLIFSDFVLNFDRIKNNFIETAISDYLKRELGILFIPGDRFIALLDNGFSIELFKSNSGFSYEASLYEKITKVTPICYTSMCRNMRTLKAKIQKMLKNNNISI